MSEDKKKIIIVHSAAPYEDTKKAIGWIIVIALILVVLVIYAIIQGVVFLAKIIWAVIQWIGLAIWFILKWVTYPIWYPIVRIVDVWNNCVWYEALFATLFLVGAVFAIVIFICKIRKGLKKGEKLLPVLAGVGTAFCLFVIIVILFWDIADTQPIEKMEITEAVEIYEGLAPEEEELETKVVKTNYILESFPCDVDWNKRYVFSQDKAIYLTVKFDNSKGYIYNRDYPTSLMFYFSHENDNRSEDDSYVPKTPISVKKGFICKNAHFNFWGDFSFESDYRKDEITFATDYKYITLSEESKSNVRWCIKEKDDYMEPGEWKIYLFMIRPDYIEKKIPTFVDRWTKIWMGLKDIRDLFKNNEVFCRKIKSFCPDELAVELVIRIK